MFKLQLPGFRSKKRSSGIEIVKHSTHNERPVEDPPKAEEVMKVIPMEKITGPLPEKETQEQIVALEEVEQSVAAEDLIQTIPSTFKIIQPHKMGEGMEAPKNKKAKSIFGKHHAAGKKNEEEKDATHKSAEEKNEVSEDPIKTIPSTIKVFSLGAKEEPQKETPKPAPEPEVKKAALPEEKKFEEPKRIQGEVAAAKWNWDDFMYPPTIPKKELINFFDQMATLLEAGITIVDTFEMLMRQNKNKSIKKLLFRIVRNIKEGKTLSTSLAEFPKVFPAMVIQLTSIGEQSGTLPELIRIISIKMEEQSDLKKKIKGAMMYPLIVIALSMALVVGMMVFAVPKLTSMYATAKVSLPEATQIVIAISNFVIAYYPMMIGLTIALFMFMSILIKKVPPVRKVFEKFIFKLPIIGPLNRDKNIALVTSNMSLLLHSGMLIDEVFLLLNKTTENINYQEQLGMIRDGLLQGKTVSQMMGLHAESIADSVENFLFPLEVAQIIRVGEQTGNMTKVLSKISEQKMKHINQFVKNISSIIEPAMIIIVGTIVAGIIIPLMLPIFNIGSTVGG